MGKVYKGYELIKAIEEREIKVGTTLLFKSTINNKAQIKVKVCEREDIGAGYYLRNENNEIVSSGWLTNSIIEVLEDEETDIQEIEEYKTVYTERCIDMEVRDKINEIIRVVNKMQQENKKEENIRLEMHDRWHII